MTTLKLTNWVVALTLGVLIFMKNAYAHSIQDFLDPTQNPPLQIVQTPKGYATVETCKQVLPGRDEPPARIMFAFDGLLVWPFRTDPEKRDEHLYGFTLPAKRNPELSKNTLWMVWPGTKEGSKDAATCAKYILTDWLARGELEENFSLGAVGYSHGGPAGLLFAWLARAKGVKLDLLFLLDYVPWTLSPDNPEKEIPDNVVKAINYYETNDPALNFRGHVIEKGNVLNRRLPPNKDEFKKDPESFEMFSKNPKERDREMGKGLFNLPPAHLDMASHSVTQRALQYSMLHHLPLAVQMRGPYRFQKRPR